MKKPMVAMLIGLAAGLGLSQVAQAEEERSWNWSPLGIGIAAPLQLPFMETDVYGLRFGGFYGANNDVYGLDCGIVELEWGDFIGAQAALFTWAEGNAYGLQLGALANVVGGRAVGVQVGCVNVDWAGDTGLQLGLINYDTDFNGLQLGAIINWNNSASAGAQLGLINSNQDAFKGCAIGLVNYSGQFNGLQLGFVDIADEMTGVQLGLFNACHKLRGVQVGLLNLIEYNERLPIMVFANASF